MRVSGGVWQQRGVHTFRGCVIRIQYWQRCSSEIEILRCIEIGISQPSFSFYLYRVLIVIVRILCVVLIAQRQVSTRILNPYHTVKACDRVYPVNIFTNRMAFLYLV